MPKPAKSLKVFRLSRPEGVREVDLGPADFMDRCRGNFSKEAPPTSDGLFDDTKASDKRWGLTAGPVVFRVGRKKK